MFRWMILFALASVCSAYKILVVYPMPSPSHGILGDGVVRVLLNAGHEVTYITPYAAKSPHVNLTVLRVSDVFDTTIDLSLKNIMNSESSLTDPRRFFNTTMRFTMGAIYNESVQQMLHDPEQTFDLVIAEWMFTELFCGLAAVYNCPYIWMYPTEPSSLALSLIDDRLNPSYNYGIFSLHAPPYSFLERAKELAFHVSLLMVKELFSATESKYFEEMYGPIIRKKGRSVPSYDEVKYNASLMFGNSHISVGQPVRLPQNFKPIRGYHIDPNVKPLPDNLKQILDGAKHGLIYFSMGSNLKSKDMPDELKQGLLKVFGELKQTVLWKFEENIDTLPKNVHIVQWAPQPSILAHPNCVLFISHGGGLSTTETVHFGKPTISIPVYGDQFTNADMAVQKGFSIRLDLDYNLPENLRIALKEVLNNPSYAAKAKEASFVYHHRPMSPSDELVHWVEHVIITKGAPHLRSIALLVPFYQKYYLDLTAVLLAIIFVLYLAGRSLCKSLCKRSNIKKKIL